MPLLPLAASDFDPFQGAIIVIALVAGFIKWLWENWQMKNDAEQRERGTPAPDPEELRRREEAWKRQMGQGAGKGGQPAPRPVRHAPSTAPTSVWDDLRKAWEDMKEAARQSQNPGQPPPPPRAQRPRPSASRQQPAPPPRRGSVAAAEDRRAPAALPEMAAAAQRDVLSVPPTVERRESSGGAFLTNLQNLRHDPALLRQAVLLHEVLGPPKALQSSTDPAI